MTGPWRRLTARRQTARDRATARRLADWQRAWRPYGRVRQPSAAGRPYDAGDGASRYGQPASWHPATLPALPAVLSPRRPRVSAGRVTVTERVRAAYEAADRPVMLLLASFGWPAQEVTP